MLEILENRIDAAHPFFQQIKRVKSEYVKTQHFKNFSVQAFLQTQYTSTPHCCSSAKEGKQLCIKNGAVEEFPKGVKISELENFNVDQNHFDPLYYFSHSLVEKLIFIELDKDISFEIEHIVDESDNALSYRVVVQVGKSVHANIYENFSYEGVRQNKILYGVDVELFSSADLTWVRGETLGKNSLDILGSHSFCVKDHASLELKSFDMGQTDVLHIYKIDLDEFSRADLAHLVFGTHKTKRGNIAQVHHNKAYAKSVQEARTILHEKATGIFDSKITVAHDAKYSSAFQNSKAILLDSNAHMYAKPQLEIYTDELEASHGSTIGSLDEDALFYLCSRGIEVKKAKQILVSSFANTLIDAISKPEFSKKVRENFEQVYEKKDLL